MGSGGGDGGNMKKIVNTITTSVQTVAASTSTAVVDMVYGLHPNSTTGGCVVQRSFEDSLRDEGINSVRVHVASTPSSAERVFQRLVGMDGQGEAGMVEGYCGKAVPRVLIVDGIALLFMRDRLRALKEENPARLLVGFVHFPFSEPFYRKESWLRAALPERMIVGPGAGKLLRGEETRLFGLLDKIIAVGAPCHSILTDKHRVPESAVILLEPTFTTLPPPLTSISMSMSEEACFSECAGGAAVAGLPGDRCQDPEFNDRDCGHYSAPSASVDGDDELLNPPRSPLRFVSVGTLCPRKGQLGLVEALGAACSAYPRELSGSMLTLIGSDGSDPAYAEAVRNAAKNISKNKQQCPEDPSVEIYVLGSLPHDRTLERLSKSDAFLMNSSFESWAVAPVEAALQGVPVVTTRVGALEQSLPSPATLWVGRDCCTTYCDKDDETKVLASAADWERALLCFAQDRKRLTKEARRAVPGLHERFGREAASFRASAVRGLLSAVVVKADRIGGVTKASLPAAWEQQQQQQRRPKTATGVTAAANELERSGLQACLLAFNAPPQPVDGVDESAVAAASSVQGRDISITDKERGDEDERERIRRAMVVHALLSVICAACLAVSGDGGVANGSLASLVASQLLLIASLAPPPTPANVVTVFRSFIPAAVVWMRAGSDFGRVTMGDVSLFGVIFVLLDIVDGKLARASKTGPTRIGAALDVESDSTAMLFLSLVASRKAWSGGVIAGVLRYLFVLATAARELPPSPIGPAGRWLAKVAALVSVIALALSVGGEGMTAITTTTSGEWSIEGGVSYPRALCFAGVAILCTSFSVDFYQIWVILPREEVKKAKKGRVDAEAAGEVLK